MGGSEAGAPERASAAQRFESALANALPNHLLKEVREIRSILRVGKFVRVYEAVLVVDGRQIIRRYVAKEHAHAASALASFKQLSRLREHGFAPPSPWRIPEPVASVGNLLVEAELHGRPWIQKLSRNSSKRAAQWLLALQRTPLVDEVKTHKQLTALSDSWTGAAGALNHELKSEGDDPRPSHGDFHPKNIRLSKGYVGVIDLEGLGLREPAADVGDAIAQLLIMTDVEGRFQDGQRAALQFWNHYRGEGFASPRRVCLHTARGLLETINYKVALARAGCEPEPSNRHLSHLAARFLEARELDDVLR